jgi:hypothetical protein
MGNLYSLRDQVKTIIQIVEGLKSSEIYKNFILVHQLCCEIYSSCYLKDGDMDWLSEKNGTLMQQFGEHVIMNSNLLSLQSGVKLLNHISKSTQNMKILMAPLTRCLIFLKSKKYENVLVVSRSILMASYIIYECEYLDQIEMILKVDIKQEICNILKSIITVKTIDANIIDVALEGISYIWLRHPSKIQNGDVFEIVIDKFKTCKHIQQDTKSMILSTFSKFLENFS